MTDRRLRAVTVALDRPAPDPSAAAVDGVALVHGPDLVLAGWGRAATVALPGGLAAAGRPGAEPLADLTAIEVDDRVGRRGTGAVALGALPFDPAAPGHLTVPALVVGADAEGAWATVVGLDPEAQLEGLAARLAAMASPATAPRSTGTPTVVPVPEPGGYRAAVAKAVEAIAGGRLEKVVLSRSLHLEGAPPYPADEVVRRLRAQEPTCTTFAVRQGPGVFVGASPELLVARHGATVTSRPLAGTVGQGASPDADRAAQDRLLGSDKDQREHRLVVEAITAVLGPWCTTLRAPAAPELSRLHSVAHLATEITGTLADPAPDALVLVAHLHPTPAVGGVPRQAALEAIEALEADRRGWWAGPVGWVDGRGDGEWMIGIRSAVLGPEGVVLRAGAGIVAGSEPQQELDETTVKLRPVLDALYPQGAVTGVA